MCELQKELARQISNNTDSLYLQEERCQAILQCMVRSKVRKSMGASQTLIKDEFKTEKFKAGVVHQYFCKPCGYSVMHKSKLKQHQFGQDIFTECLRVGVVKMLANRKQGRSVLLELYISDRKPYYKQACWPAFTSIPEENERYENICRAKETSVDRYWC